MDFFAALRATTNCVNYLAAQGMEVNLIRGVDAVHGAVAAINKPYLTPWLDPAANDFTDANSFWLLASRDGVPQIIGGGRVDDLGHDAASKIGAMFERGYPGALKSVNPECSQRLRGRVAYFGDLKSVSTRGLGRKSVFAFLGVANYIAATQMQADTVYSFMRMKDILRGSADVNGFTCRILNPLSWSHDVPEHRDPSEQIVYRPRADNDAYFSMVTQELGCSELGSSRSPFDPPQAVQA